MGAGHWVLGTGCWALDQPWRGAGLAGQPHAHHGRLPGALDLLGLLPALLVFAATRAQLFVKPRISPAEASSSQPGPAPVACAEKPSCSALTRPPACASACSSQLRFSEGTFCGARVTPGGWVVATAAEWFREHQRCQKQGPRSFPVTRPSPPGSRAICERHPCPPVHGLLGNRSRPPPRLPGPTPRHALCGQGALPLLDRPTALSCGSRTRASASPVPEAHAPAGPLWLPPRCSALTPRPPLPWGRRLPGSL